MRITWTIEGKGSGSAKVATVDDAATALTAAVRDAHSDLGTQTLSHVLLTSVAPLRQLLVTHGRAAVEQGQEWESGAGGIFVTLSPN